MAVHFTPYIYSQPELRRLLQAITPERTNGVSPQTVRTLLLLLYGAGLRLSEALKLEAADVDVRAHLLHVRHSTFFKSRLVPIGPKLAKVLADYLAERLACAGSRCFLCANQGTPVSRATAERIFRALRLAAEVKRPTSCRYQPRLHDLRHTMATHCLVNAYRTGGRCAGATRQSLRLLGTRQSRRHPKVSDDHSRPSPAGWRPLRPLCPRRFP
jgi:site-specific recombinase XerD